MLLLWYDLRGRNDLDHFLGWVLDVVCMLRQGAFFVTPNSTTRLGWHTWRLLQLLCLLDVSWWAVDYRLAWDYLGVFELGGGESFSLLATLRWELENLHRHLSCGWLLRLAYYTSVIATRRFASIHVWTTIRNLIPICRCICDNLFLLWQSCYHLRCIWNFDSLFESLADQICWFNLTFELIILLLDVFRMIGGQLHMLWLLLSFSLRLGPVRAGCTFLSRARPRHSCACCVLRAELFFSGWSSG